MRQQSGEKVPMQHRDEPQSPDRPAGRHAPEYLRIDTGRARRWKGVVAWWLCFAAVGALLAYLLMQFTHSRLLAFGLVAFMLVYMILMSAWANRNMENRDE